MKKSATDYTFLIWLLFVATSGFTLAMTIMSRNSVDALYLFFSQVLPVEPALVKKHAHEISNIGHVFSCLLLTMLAYFVFRHWLKAVFAVACLSVLGECIQSFSVTRQANLEDIALCFAGIVLALALIFLRKAWALWVG